MSLHYKLVNCNLKTLIYSNKFANCKLNPITTMISFMHQIKLLELNRESPIITKRINPNIELENESSHLNLLN
jgi:hypothetical protein